MTREEKLAKLQGFRTSAESDVKDYNDLIQQGKFTEASPLTARIEENVNEYTALARTLAFDDCKEKADPMLEAVTVLNFTTIAIKDGKEGDAKIPVRAIIEREKPIDLIRLHKYVGGTGIGRDERWFDLIQKLNFLLTADRAKDLGLDASAVNDSYEMSKIATEISFGKTPTSKTNLLKTLQIIIDAMLGEGYKAKSHDVNYLMSVYSKRGRKALTVACSNHRNFTNYIAEVCHRIVTDKSYEVEFKTKK